MRSVSWRSDALSGTVTPISKVYVRQGAPSFSLLNSRETHSEMAYDDGDIRPILGDSSETLRVYTLASANVNSDWYYNTDFGTTFTSFTDTYMQALKSRLGIYNNTMYYISTNGDLRSKVYSGSWAASTQVDTQTFPVNSAVAPTSDSVFVLYYDGALKVMRWTGSAWEGPVIAAVPSESIWTDVQWFDAEPLYGSTYLLTITWDGNTRAFLWNTGVLSEPFPVYVDDEYAVTSCLISGLSTYGSHVWGVARVTIQDSDDSNDVSYCTLCNTSDGRNWGFSEWGYIPTILKGKLIISGSAYVVSHAIVASGTYTAWLGNSTLGDDISDSVISWRTSTAYTQATDGITNIDDSGLTSTLLTDGNELIRQIGISGQTPITYSTEIIDDPRRTINHALGTREVVSRGQFRNLLTYRQPFDIPIESPTYFWNDFSDESKYGAYQSLGSWNIDDGKFTCNTPGTAGTGLLVVAEAFRGEFVARARMRSVDVMGEFGVAFWVEDNDNFWCATVSSNTLAIKHIVSGTASTVASTSMTGSLGSWYDIYLSVHRGLISVRYNDGSWSSALSTQVPSGTPKSWNAGLVTFMPATALSADMEDDDRSASVSSTLSFPSSGTLIINDEEIPYTSKTSTTFLGLTRGTDATWHISETAVYLSNMSIECDRAEVYETRHPFTAKQAAELIIKRSGAPTRFDTLIDDDFDILDSSWYVYPEIGGASVTGGEVTLNGIMTQRISKPSWHITAWYTMNSSYISLLLWCDDASDMVNGSIAGYEIKVETTQVSLIDLSSSSVIDVLPVSVNTWGRLDIYTNDDTIYVFERDMFIAAFHVESPRSGYFGLKSGGGKFGRVRVFELCDYNEGFVWTADEPAANALFRLLDGRNAMFTDTYSGIRLSAFKRDRQPDLSYDGSSVISYSIGASDNDWATAVRVYGAEHVGHAVLPGADRIRWLTIQNPYLMSPDECRVEGLKALQRLTMKRNARGISGRLDPSLEVGDVFSLSTIKGVTGGDFQVSQIAVQWSSAPRPNLSMEVSGLAIVPAVATGVYSDDAETLQNLGVFDTTELA